MERKRPYTIRIAKADMKAVAVDAVAKRRTKSKWIRDCAMSVVAGNLPPLPVPTVFDPDDAMEFCFSVFPKQIEAWRKCALALRMSIPQWFRSVVIPYSKMLAEKTSTEDGCHDPDERVLFTVSVRADIRMIFNKAALAQQMTVSDWARATLLEAAVYHIKNPKA